MDTVKNLMELPFFFKMDFEGSYEVLLSHKYTYFHLHTFHNETTALFKSFQEHFVSVFLLNKKILRP